MAAYNEVNHFDRGGSAFAPLRLLSNSTKKPLFFALDELQPVICSSKTGRDALRENVLALLGSLMETKLQQPDALGHWGLYGGRFVPETLMAPLEELTEAFLAARDDQGFQAELGSLLRDYAGRPTPLFFAARLTEHAGGGRIYLKREDLLHTGAHKINNTLGQVLLARRMGKRRIIAETGA